MKNMRNVKVAILAAGALITGLAATTAQAEIYLASTNGGGTLSEYSTTAGLQGSIVVAGINNIAVSPYNGNVWVGTGGGILEQFDSNLVYLNRATDTLGTADDVAVRPDNGDAIVTYASQYWGHANSNGGGWTFGGAGFTGAKVASGTDGKTWLAYNLSGSYDTYIFNQSYGVYQSGSTSGAGQEMVANPITGDMWFANDKTGFVGRYTSNGVGIAQVGLDWTNNPHLAVAKDGRVWIASGVDGGSLASWNVEGAFLGITATNLGTNVDLVVDPVTGDIVMGMQNGSPLGDLLVFNSTGVFQNSLGSNLGIVELSAMPVPEPTSMALLVMGSLLLWRRTKNK